MFKPLSLLEVYSQINQKKEEKKPNDLYQMLLFKF